MITSSQYKSRTSRNILYCCSHGAMLSFIILSFPNGFLVIYHKDRCQTIGTCKTVLSQYNWTYTENKVCSNERQIYLDLNGAKLLGTFPFPLFSTKLLRLIMIQLLKGKWQTLKIKHHSLVCVYIKCMLKISVLQLHCCDCHTGKGD